MSAYCSSLQKASIVLPLLLCYLNPYCYVNFQSKLFLYFSVITRKCCWKKFAQEIILAVFISPHNHLAQGGFYFRCEICQFIRLKKFPNLYPNYSKVLAWAFSKKFYLLFNFHLQKWRQKTPSAISFSFHRAWALPWPSIQIKTIPNQLETEKVRMLLVGP